MSVFEENPILRILPHLGTISLDSFSNRLRLQKVSYLAQEMGLDGGFFFNYYHRGPYSPDLTKLLYRGSEIDAFSQVELSRKERQIIDNLHTFLRDKIDDSRTLELFASIWYLLPYKKITEDDKKYVLETILETKPRYSADEVKDAISKIIDFKNNYGLET